MPAPRHRVQPKPSPTGRCGSGGGAVWPAQRWSGTVHLRGTASRQPEGTRLLASSRWPVRSAAPAEPFRGFGISGGDGCGALRYRTVGVDAGRGGVDCRSGMRWMEYAGWRGLSRRGVLQGVVGKVCGWTKNSEGAGDDERGGAEKGSKDGVGSTVVTGGGCVASRRWVKPHQAARGS